MIKPLAGAGSQDTSPGRQVRPALLLIAYALLLFPIALAFTDFTPVSYIGLLSAITLGISSVLYVLNMGPAHTLGRIGLGGAFSFSTWLFIWRLVAPATSLEARKDRPIVLAIAVLLALFASILLLYLSFRETRRGMRRR